MRENLLVKADGRASRQYNIAGMYVCVWGRQGEQGDSSGSKRKGVGSVVRGGSPRHC